MSTNIPDQVDQSTVHKRTATIAISTTTSGSVKVGPFRSGLVKFSGGASEFSADTITFQSAHAKTDTFNAIAAASASIVNPANDTWYPLPAACFYGNYLKVVTDNAVAAAATLTFQLST